MTEKNELTVVERAAVALASPQHEKELRELVAASASILAIKNKDAREQCHSALMTLKGRRTAIVRAAKAAREDATAFSKAIIEEEKRLVAIAEPEEIRLQDLRDDWDEAREAERQARLNAERDRIKSIREDIDYGIKAFPTSAVGLSAAKIAAMLETLEAEEITLERYQEFSDEAEMVKTASVDKLKEMLRAQQAHEQAIAEAARQAEADRVERERVAEANRIEAKRLADLAAEIERQAKEARDKQAEADRIAREQREAADRQAQAERDERDRIAAAKLEAQQAEIARQQAVIDAARAEQERIAREAREAAEAEARAKREAEEAEAARIAQAEADRIFAEQEAIRLAEASAEAERQAQQMAAMPRIAPAEPVEMVSIPKKEYEMLLKDSEFLQCLQNAGVDNWDGFDYACELHDELRAA